MTLTRLRRVLSSFLLLLVGLTIAALPAWAQDETDEDPIGFDPNAGVVDILQINGLLDPLVVDFVIDNIEEADRLDGRVRAVVLNVNSRGSVVDADEVARIADAIIDADVPVTMWIGPSNARALGPWVELAALVDELAIASGARIGNVGDPVLPASYGASWGDADTRLVNDTIGAEEAAEAGITSLEAPTLGEFVVGLGSAYGIETRVVEGDDGILRTETRTTPRFKSLSILPQQLHTVASPPVAYLLFTIGLALLVFEFYTAGVGVAGVVGAAMFVLGSYGLWVLPVNVVAVVLLVLSMFAFSVDVQTGVPRFWTIVGAIALVVGTVTLYGDGVSMSWIPMVVGIVGITMMMVTGMPTMVRTRFSTPTIGREWMIGKVGEVIEAVAPDGVVSIDDALWKARTNRATPIAVGESARVASVEGLVLEVEPEDGAARDYRERRSSR